MDGIVLNRQVNLHLHLIKDETLRGALRNGAAYALAAGGTGIRNIFNFRSLTQVVQTYTKVLRAVWFVGMAVGLAGFVIVPSQKQIELKKENKTEFGLKKRRGSIKEGSYSAVNRFDVLAQ